MRVGLIIYGLDRPLTGIGRYTKELVQALAALDEGLQLTLLLAGAPGPLAGDPRFRYQPLPGCARLPGLMTLGNLELPLLAQNLKLDVIHDTTGVTPMFFGGGRARVVVTVHDVFPLSIPGYSSTIDSLIYRRWLPIVQPRVVDQMITDSRASQNDILRYLPFPAARLSVIPAGVSANFRPLPANEVTARLRDQFRIDFPYLLYVGSLTRRKNIERALEAFSHIHQQLPNHRFVLVGPRAWQQSPIEDVVARCGIADKVFLTGPVSDDALPYLYGGADLFVFPSLYEGYGLPVVEAMACGTPVLTSNVSSLPEAEGGAGVTVDPHDVNAMADAMLRLLNSPALRAQMREQGIARVKPLTWEQTARSVVEVYRAALKG